MNTDVFVNDDFKVTLNANSFENYLSFSAAISFETALDAAALKMMNFTKRLVNLLLLNFTINTNVGCLRGQYEKRFRKTIR
jgi:hypothetical protein